MTSRLDHLRSAYEAACPGPWEARNDEPRPSILTAGYFVALATNLMPDILEALAAARDLYERVEMDESVGICLSDRAPTLNLGTALARLETEETR